MEKEFELAPVPKWFFEELTEACAEVKNYKSALHYCNKALEYDPLDVDLLYTKALILYKDYKFHEAMAALELVNKCDVDQVYFKDAEVLYYSIVSLTS